MSTRTLANSEDLDKMPHSCTDPEGGQRVRTPSEKSQNIGFSSNTGPDPLKNHKATKPAFNVGSLSARQQNVILMAFRWWANDGPLIVFRSTSPHYLKTHTQKRQIWTPSSKTDPGMNSYRVCTVFKLLKFRERNTLLQCI